MGDITVVGLGLMGAALARSIQRAGLNLVVWNRSPDKMQPFLDDGVASPPELAAAVTASPVVLICVDNYTTTRMLFGSDQIAPMLQGRVVVQLSSGKPKEATDLAAWFHDRGALYLDGAILAGPSEIGTDSAKILLSGDEDAHRKAIGLLRTLANGNIRYLGENVKAASTLDLAWLMTRFGNFMGAIHGANICLSEGVDVHEFGPLVTDNEALVSYLNVITENSFDNFSASLQIWADALHHIQEQGVEANINTEIPDFIAELFSRAKVSGYGQKNVMSLLKVLQEDQ